MTNTILKISLRALASAAMVATLVGCGSAVKLDETPVESRMPTAIPAGNAVAGAGQGGSASGAAASQVAAIDLARDAANAANAATSADMDAAKAGRTVYFDFDSFVVREDYRGLIERHAKLLAANKSRRLVVEGHTDDRGGSEYNLALGQKRAEAVAKSLVLLGANDAQMEAVSFGKERPADPGNDEAAWAKNRRAELKDR